MKIEMIEGAEGNCICINNYRVAGPKPWGGGKVIKSWNTKADDIMKSIEVFEIFKDCQKYIKNVSEISLYSKGDFADFGLLDQVENIIKNAEGNQ